MITRRDVAVAAVAAAATLGVTLAAQQGRPPIQESEVYTWNAFPITKTAFGSQRQIMRAPTATLDELEMHVTTLNAGDNSHDPHRHVNEELVIIREGELETLSRGVWKKAGPGDVIFNASDQLHGVRNIGKVPVTYHVINWRSPGQKPAQ